MQKTAFWQNQSLVLELASVLWFILILLFPLLNTGERFILFVKLTHIAKEPKRATHIDLM